MGRPRAARKGRLTFLVYRAVAAFLRPIPRPIVMLAASLVGEVSALVSRERREVVAANLRVVVGGSASERFVRRLVRAAFRSYARYWGDVAKLSPRDLRRLDRRYVPEGVEHIRDALRAGGIIFALPHLGSWEIGGLWASREGFPFTTVAEDAVSEEMTQWFIHRRERLGMQILRLDANTSVALLRELRAKRAIALVADRDVVGDGIDVTFFGRKTQAPAGPAVLALRSGATIIPCVVYQDRYGMHQARFGPPLKPTREGSLRDDVMRLTSELVAVFEGFIRVAPEQWHVFQPVWPGARSPSRVETPGA